MNEAAAARRVSDVYARAKRADQATEARMRAYVDLFLPIVKSEVLRFKMRVPKHIELEELHGVAICGLMRAFERYAGESEEAFGGYVRKRVRGAILDELRRLDSMTRGARKKARLYDAAVQRIEQREGRLATESEIRGELGLDAGDFDRLLEELRPITFFSIDEVDPLGGVDLTERLEDERSPAAGEALESKEMLAQIRERLGQLPEVQRKILHMYYFKDFRLAEIAEVFQLSEGRISQLHTQAIRSMRSAFERQYRREESF